MMAELCMRLGIHYTGLDISEKMIEECRRRHHNTTSATFCVGRIQNLPFEDNFFDVLLCMGAFEYVPAEEEDAAMAEMIRVIKPGGLLIISYLNRLSPYWLWDKHVYAKARTLKRLANRSLHRGGLDKPDAPPRYFTERECHKRMKSLHLKIIDTIYFGFNVFFRPLDRWLPRLAVWVSKKLNSQSRSPLRILAMAFIIVVQKAGYVGSDVVDLVLNLAEPTQGAVRATEHFRHSVE
jgi:ubiquinone/menaquinone biosynthesis C-methylase UbiE